MEQRSAGEGAAPVRPEDGLSLVEVMVAAVLVIVFVGSVLTLAVRQGAHRQVNLETMLATTAAIDAVERVRNEGFATLPSLDGSGFDVPSVNGSPAGLRALPGDPDGLPGRIAVTVEEQQGGTYFLYRVTATVDWRGVSGPRRVQVTTLVSERKK